jgi:hypothetical protein
VSLNFNISNSTGIPNMFLHFLYSLVSIIALVFHNRWPVTWWMDRVSATDRFSGNTSHHENKYANTSMVWPAYHCNEEDSIPEPTIRYQ